MTDSAAILCFVREAARLAPELASWLGAAVWRGLSPSRRRRIRDDLLREAARRLGPVSCWQKSIALAELARRPGARPGVSTAEGLVALAAAVYRPARLDRSLSVSQVFRVVTCTRPLELQVDPGPRSDATLGIFPERKGGG